MDERAENPALASLIDVLYADLHRLARRQRRRSGGGSETMRTTALVHEAYLKLARQGVFRDRGHFLATAALAIRQVLVDHARAQLTDKRDPGGIKLPLEAADGVLAEDGERIVGLDEALKNLEALNPRYARVVECRYFAGYSDAETALALGITERTVQRDWVKAKALLYEALDPRGT